MSVLNANSVDPDQTPQNAASDMGLHYLLMSYLGDTGHIWFNLHKQSNLSGINIFGTMEICPR